MHPFLYWSHGSRNGSVFVFFKLRHVLDALQFIRTVVAVFRTVTNPRQRNALARIALMLGGRTFLLPAFFPVCVYTQKLLNQFILFLKFFFSTLTTRYVTEFHPVRRYKTPRPLVAIRIPAEVVLWSYHLRNFKILSKDPKNVKNSLYLAPLEPLVAKAFRAA